MLIELTDNQQKNLLAFLNRVHIQGVSEAIEYLNIIKAIQTTIVVKEKTEQL